VEIRQSRRWVEVVRETIVTLGTVVPSNCSHLRVGPCTGLSNLSAGGISLTGYPTSNRIGILLVMICIESDYEVRIKEKASRT